MSDRRTVTAYQYDGSFEGMLCCIFESFARRENPSDIYSAQQEQLSLCPMRVIETNTERARRVAISIPKKISPLAADWIKKLFLSCAEHRELLALQFLKKGYLTGASITRMLQDETVSAVMKAVQFVENESHLLKGFLRFSERAGILTAVIDPKNVVLPLIAPHFADRLPSETFLIYDRSHGMAMIHQAGTIRIFAADNIDFAPEDQQELQYQELWKRFYQTIAIEGRLNPKCRMTHCPKRYWKNMTELCGEFSANQTATILQNPAASAIMEEKQRHSLPQGRTIADDLYTESG